MKRSLLLIIVLGLGSPLLAQSPSLATADYQNRLYLPSPPTGAEASQLSVSIFSGSVGPAGNPATPNNGILYLERSAFGFPVAATLNPIECGIITTVKLLTNGSGNATISPAQGPYAACQMVTLTAMPTNCYWAFSHWYDGAGNYTANPLMIGLGASNCFTAAFTNIVTVIAEPDTNWSFLGWLGAADGPNPNVTFTMNGDICAQAVFAAPLITVASPNGSVVRWPQAALYPYGTSVRLTALPEANHYFVGWSGAASGTNNPLNITANNPFATNVANFAPLPAERFALTTLVEGRGQVQTHPQANHYAASTQVTNTAQPSANEMFVRWEGDTNGAVFLDTTRLALTMNTRKVVKAVFTSRPRVDIVSCFGQLNREGFELSVTGDLGARYLIQATTTLTSPPGLISWTDLGTVTNTLGMVEFLDVTSTNFMQRFYRAKEAQ